MDLVTVTDADVDADLVRFCDAEHPGDREARGRILRDPFHRRLARQALSMPLPTEAERKRSALLARLVQVMDELPGLDVGLVRDDASGWQLPADIEERLASWEAQAAMHHSTAAE